MHIKSSVPLANYTTWQIGGPAEWLAEPTSIKELQELLKWGKQQRVTYQIIGAGSNLLINDSGIAGLSLCMRKLNGSEINKTSGLVEAWAGEPLPTLARRSARAGLHGLEWAIGIPGTVGGAAVMNAGAQGDCTAQWLDSVRVIDLNGKGPFEIKRDELEYDYRYSRLQQEDLLVISTRFKLEPGHDSKEISLITNKNLNHRTSTQPYHLPSCGSVFRNPEPLKAGQLIEELGLKGHRIGGAEISNIHANFITNNGQATAQDIKELIAVVQERMLKKYGLSLIPEVKQLGFETND